jgi:16S rRNA processing protein RimM
MSSQPRRILLGEITTVHGIKGEVIIRSHTANPEDIASYGKLTDESGTRTFRITSARAGPKGGVVARIEGIVDRTAAEKLRGTALYVDRSALPPPEGDNASYITDLVGLRAIDRNGAPLGAVTGVHNFGAGDMIEIAFDGQRTSELIPFTDACVPVVDVAAGTVTVTPPPTVEAAEDQPDETDNDDA